MLVWLVYTQDFISCACRKLQVFVEGYFVEGFQHPALVISHGNPSACMSPCVLDKSSPTEVEEGYAVRGGSSFDLF